MGAGSLHAGRLRREPVGLARLPLQSCLEWGQPSSRRAMDPCDAELAAIKDLDGAKNWVGVAGHIAWSRPAWIRQWPPSGLRPVANPVTQAWRAG